MKESLSLCKKIIIAIYDNVNMQTLYICCDKVFAMRGFRFLVFHLFACLAFLSPHDSVGFSVWESSSVEVISATDDHQHAPDLIEVGSQIIQIFDTSQNSKLPFVRFSDTSQKVISIDYASKLLYLQIGNAIELHLTTTTIIFPFHCFT